MSKAVEAWRLNAPPGISLAQARQLAGVSGTALPPQRQVTIIHEHRYSDVAKTLMSNFGSTPWTNPFTVFEALSNDGDRTPITTAGLGPTLAAGGRWLPSPVVNFQRLLLAAISEYLYDNNGLVSYGVDMIVNYSVPVIPKAFTDDAAWNELADAYFKEWMATADFSGRFHYSIIQEIACKSIDKAGDFGLIATSENGFPQLQCVESWQIGALKVPTIPNIRIIDGVLLDAKGVVSGYAMQTMDGVEIVPANTMKLLYDPDRYYAFRGMTPLRRGSNDIRDQSDLKGFEKKAAKIHAALAAWLDGGPLVEDDWGGFREEHEPPVQDQSRHGWGGGDGDGDNPDSGNGQAPVVKHERAKFNIADLLGGDIPVLNGQKLQLLDNKRPGHGTIEFLTELAGYFIAGLGLPPAFFSDTKLTGPNIRAVIGKAQRKFNRRQQMFIDLAEWIWPRVIADGIAKKKLAPNPQFAKITHQRPARLTIDLGDQAANERADVQSGQMTRQERYGNRAKDWQHETDQFDRELDYIFDKAARKAAQYKIPIETVLAAYGIEPQQGKNQQQSPAQQGTPVPDGTK